MRYIPLFLLLCACESGYYEEKQALYNDVQAAYSEAKALSDDPATRARLIYAMPLYRNAFKRLDSLITRGPSIRYYSDSLARLDSIVYGGLLLGYMSHTYNAVDTVEAVFAYYKALPWLTARNLRQQATETRMFAEVLGKATHITESPNTARQAYQVFAHAEQLAFATDDTLLIQQVFASMEQVAAELQVLPDSIQAAFAPSLVKESHRWGLIASTMVLGLALAGGTLVVGTQPNKHQQQPEA